MATSMILSLMSIDQNVESDSSQWANIPSPLFFSCVRTKDSDKGPQLEAPLHTPTTLIIGCFGALVLLTEQHVKPLDTFLSIPDIHMSLM
ncbi:branched-chain-amino-acid aminotransferase [Moniliophthora roreri]|nr:branched-chain-amino-acid aminotransferase [Moniliophthora roreri]